MQGATPGRRTSIGVGDRKRAARAKTARRAPRLWIIAPALGLLLLFRNAQAEEVFVPASVQVALVAKLVTYDRNFAARAGDRAHILIVSTKGDGDSARVSGQLKSAFAEVDRIGGLPHDESIVEYSDVTALAAACRDQRAAVVYIAPGLAREVEGIGRALVGLSVLSVGAVGGYASKGLVIDFFVEGGKPKIALNLAQARSQQVALAPEVVRIMRVLE